MERLTLKTKSNNIMCLSDYYTGQCDECEHFSKIIEKLAAYEQAEEDGLLVKIPCKEGTKAFEIVFECNALVCKNNTCSKCAYNNSFIKEIVLDLTQIILKKDEFEKTIFFSREKALEKLKELKTK